MCILQYCSVAVLYSSLKVSVCMHGCMLFEDTLSFEQ